MRVLTEFGFGEVERGGNRIEVTLDSPFLGEKIKKLDSSQVFCFGDKGIIRVLNVSGVGLVTNLQFYMTEAEALACFANVAKPPDETWFYIDFATGLSRSSQAMGALTEDYLMMHPWIDRWGKEPGSVFDSMFDSEEIALAAFEEEKDRMAGSTGISSGALFSTRDGKLLGFYILVAPPLGRIFDWQPQQPSLPSSARLTAAR